MAGFVRRRKKWPECVSNRCKDSFSRKKYFGVRGTLIFINNINNNNNNNNNDDDDNNNNNHPRPKHIGIYQSLQ